MSEWEKKFSKSALERGRTLCLNHRIVDLKQQDEVYTGAILGRNRHEVMVRVKDGKLVRGKCNCPMSKSGSMCEHMAALLYEINGEAEKEALRKDKEMKERLEKQKKELEAKHIQEEKEAKERAKREHEEMLAVAREAEKERQARREAREKRKAEKQRKEKERKAQAEQRRQQEYEKLQAEEAKRQEAREKKENEARKKQERKRQQEEARRLADQRQKEEEEKKQREMIEARVEEKQLKNEMTEVEIQGKTGKNQEYELLGDSWEQESKEEIRAGIQAISSLEKYSYFNIDQIVKSIEFKNNVIKKGKQIIANRHILVEDISSGFDAYTGTICGQIHTCSFEGAREYRQSILFDRTSVLMAECNCPVCQKDRNRWLTRKTTCLYTAAAFELLRTELEEKSIADATDRSGYKLLSAFQKKHVSQVIAGVEGEEESLSLEPRLIKFGQKLELSFKVGRDKLYVVKDLGEFLDYVDNGTTEVYGKNTKINHSIENFTENSRNWIGFIRKIVQEENRLQERLEGRGYYYAAAKSKIGNSLDLFGWRLDTIYEMMERESIEYEDRSGSSKKKLRMTAGTGNPQMKLQIAEKKIAGESQFQGVEVSGSLPKLFYGATGTYFIDQAIMKKVDKNYADKIIPFTELADGGRFSFTVGRNRLSSFYQQVLPELEEVADIKEENAEKFRNYLLPEGKYQFYLDAENGSLLCRAAVRYADREFSIMDSADETGLYPGADFRNVAGENEVLYLVARWFPYVEWEEDLFRCKGEEEAIYQTMAEGVPALQQLGEVRCTKRFKNMQQIRKVKVAVGVSVSEGLLNLGISTEGVPKEELMSLLAGYRQKKKYYRLKDGAFVNLEEEQLKMLAELADTLQLKPKEFIKGKMHIPLYRTLYLDRMLEENEEVYSSRDAHFRELVKEFKTVNDADFEEPKSLARIMRKYQKLGYKWMRTLEAWHFGGILADDMGLGKTLQVIAVLLAAKQEGKCGTSLVVAPAALIFNWEEEIKRFAPELKVQVIAGNQTARQQQISDWEQADVLVTSYDLLKRDIAFYEDKKFHYEVIDEAQYIKNHTTAAAKAVKVIQSEVRYALTGTPVENRLSELWSIFDYLMPGFLYSYDVFRHEIEQPIVKNKDEEAMARLQKMTAPFILRRLKENVLKDLPEKLEENRYVKMEEEQQKLYDAQVLHLKQVVAENDDQEFNKNRFQVLAELTKLRQICCDPSLCFENYKGGTAKTESCIQLIQSAIDGGHRMLLFSQFTSMLDILKERLDKEKIEYYMITGSTSKEERLRLVKEFNAGEVPLFLISLKAGGVGLNLTGADMVIHYDPWWNVAVQNQATDRAYRIGQKKKVTVYKLLVRNTIEEKIQKLQETKKELADQIVGGEAGQLTTMSREDFLSLLEG